MNSIFAEQAKGIDIEYREDAGGSSTGQCSYSQWADAEILKVENNIFQNVADGTAAGIFKVVSEQDGDKNDLFTVPEAANTDFAAYFETAMNKIADVGVTAANPTTSGNIQGADFTGADEWFTVVDYYGAFAPNQNWAKGWTLSLDVDAQNNPFVSAEERSIEISAVVYPNPMLDFATVKFENESGMAHSFRLYDMSGRVCQMMDNIYNNSFQINRDGLRGGLYIYRLSNDNGIVSEGKLIVK